MTLAVLVIMSTPIKVTLVEGDVDRLLHRAVDVGGHQRVVATVRLRVLVYLQRAVEYRQSVGKAIPNKGLVVDLNLLAILVPRDVGVRIALDSIADHVMKLFTKFQQLDARRSWLGNN